MLVGFAAETENLLQNAHRKLESKHLDLIVLNDVSQPGAGFNVDTNIATLITPDSQTEYPLRTKKQLAEDILDAVLDIRKQKKHKEMDCSQMRSSPFLLHNRRRQNPLLHPHGCALTGRGRDAQVVHERLHDGKTHAAAFLLRVRGKNGSIACGMSAMPRPLSVISMVSSVPSMLARRITVPRVPS